MDMNSVDRLRSSIDISLKTTDFGAKNTVGRVPEIVPQWEFGKSLPQHHPRAATKARSQTDAPRLCLLASPARMFALRTRGVRERRETFSD